MEYDFFLTEYPEHIEQLIECIPQDIKETGGFALIFKAINIEDEKMLIRSVRTNTGFACVFGDFVVIHYNGKFVVCLFDEVESLSVDHRTIKYPSSD